MHSFFIFTISFFLCPSLVASWPKIFRNIHSGSFTVTLPTTSKDDEGHLANLQEGMLSEKETSALFLNIRAINSYDQKSDCFRRAAANLKYDCMMDDPGEEERVRAAVSMTLCELATARHHSTPLECSPFFLDSENLVSGPSHLSNCVDALSRSAQHWSSYSGYMREIPQLCSSLRRWNDLDAAKSLYKNATLEKLALLRLLFNREKRQEELIERWETHLEKLQGLAHDLQLTSQMTDSINHRLKFDLNNLMNEMFHTLVTSVEDIRRMDAEQHLQSASQLDLRLGQVADQHALTLSSALPSFEYELRTQLASVFTAVRDQHEAMAVVAMDAYKQWSSFSSDIHDLRDVVNELSQAAWNASQELQVHVELASLAEERQLAATRSAEQLADSLDVLNNLTRNEFLAINETATALHLLKQTTTSNHWTESLLWLIQTIMRGGTPSFVVFSISFTDIKRKVDHMHLEAIAAMPLFRLAAFILQVLWKLFNLVSYSLINAIVLLLSMRRWYKTMPNQGLEVFKRLNLKNCTPNSDTNRTIYKYPLKHGTSNVVLLDLCNAAVTLLHPSHSEIKSHLDSNVFLASHLGSGTQKAFILTSELAAYIRSGLTFSGILFTVSKLLVLPGSHVYHVYRRANNAE